MPLTKLQQRYVEEYLVDLCSVRAARRAGYSGRSRTSYRGPAVKAAIDAALAERAKRQAQAAEVIEALREIAVAAEANPRERLAAITLLSKYIGLFGDKPEEKRRISHEEALRARRR